MGVCIVAHKASQGWGFFEKILCICMETPAKATLSQVLMERSGSSPNKNRVYVSGVLQNFT